MSKTLVVISLVLAMASVSYGDYPIDLSNGFSSWGPVVIPDPPTGCAVVCPIGWGFIGMIEGGPDAYGNSVSSTAFDQYTTVSLDVHVEGSDWSGDNGFQFGLVVNSGSTGWQQADVVPGIGAAA